MVQNGSTALEDRLLEEKRLTAGDSHGSIIPYSEISDMEVLLPDGRVSKISKDTDITKIKTFAGKGTKTVYRDADRLSCLYGSESSEWEKVRGDGYVDFDGKSTHCELHWSECSGIGRVEMKVKRWFE